MKQTNIKPVRSFLALMVSALVSSSCFSQGSESYPLTDRTPRVSSLGFSFTPPPGTNWLESFSKQTIIYSKITDPNIFTFYTGATEIQTKQPFDTAASFLEFIKEKKGDHAKHDSRYKNVNSTYKIESETAPLCVAYHQNYEDHEAKNLGDNAFLLIENKGLVCLHPDSRNVGVDVYYSYRFTSWETNLPFRGEAETFIKSLKFAPLNKRKS